MENLDHANIWRVNCIWYGMLFQQHDSGQIHSDDVVPLRWSCKAITLKSL